MARPTPVFLLPKQKVGTGWNVGTLHLALSPTRQTDFGANGTYAPPAAGFHSCSNSSSNYLA
jgi:hypothetical protein